MPPPNPLPLPLVPHPPFLHDVPYETLNAAQQGVVHTMRSLEHDWTSETTAEELKASMAEALTPYDLFDSEVAIMPSIYLEIHKLLDRRGAELGIHATRRIPTLLADWVYANTPDHDLAMDLATAIITGRHRSTSSSKTATDGNTGTMATTTINSVDRLAYNISMRYRDASPKFSGEHTQIWPEYVADYLLMARDNHLTVEQRYQYLHYALAGDAKRFYLNMAQGHATTFSEAVAMIDAEYNSTAKQMQVMNLLSNHKLSSLVSADKDTKTALMDTYNMIVRLTPLVPQTYRSDANMVDFLRSAAVGYPWATSSLQKLNAGNMTFQQFYTDLQSSLQLYEETATAAIANGIATPMPGSVPRAMNADVLYTGQGTYGRPNRHVGATTPRQMAAAALPRLTAATPVPRMTAGPPTSQTTTTPRFDPLTIAGCLNCDNPGHTMRDCRAPVNTVRAAQRKLEYWSKKKAGKPVGAAILFSLCSQLDAMVGAYGELHSASHPPDMESLEGEADEPTLYRTLVMEMESNTQPSPDTDSSSRSGLSPRGVSFSDPVISNLLNDGAPDSTPHEASVFPPGV